MRAPLGIEPGRRRRVAVIGSGISGLACAHVLGPHHDVVLFEADHRLGGHANTVTVTDPGVGPLAVDTGFIVHNDRNYPNLVRLFGELGVPVQDTEMSFAVTAREFGPARRLFTYRATSPRTLFADRANLVRPQLWRMLADIARFHRDANRLLDRQHDGNRPTPTLAEFLEARRYSPEFVNGYLIPLGAAVWSANPSTFSEFPATALFGFLRHHGLLSVGDRPRWRTIVGGSRVYVEAIASRFDGTIRLATPVSGISRDDDGVMVRAAGTVERFDSVVMACHSDQALSLLDDASVAEKEVLGAIAYQPNVATLHTDTAVLSPLRRAWAAWNYECPGHGSQPPAAAAVTYDMTTLQRLEGSRRYLVSLNSDERVDPDAALASFSYAHPVFDRAAIDAQGRFEEIDGVRGTHFCGAYWGYGFHEDGIASALRVCRRLGVEW